MSLDVADGELRTNLDASMTTRISGVFTGKHQHSYLGYPENTFFRQ